MLFDCFKLALRRVIWDTLCRAIVGLLALTNYLVAEKGEVSVWLRCGESLGIRCGGRASVRQKLSVSEGRTQAGAQSDGRSGHRARILLLLADLTHPAKTMAFLSCRSRRAARLGLFASRANLDLADHVEARGLVALRV